MYQYLNIYLFAPLYASKIRLNYPKWECKVDQECPVLYHLLPILNEHKIEVKGKHKQ